MHVAVNGVQLFLDVEGSKLVPDGPVMREKPTLLLLHGGAGADHSICRPAYRPWPISPRSSISTTVAMGAARMARENAGTWRNGAMMFAPSATRSVSSIRSCRHLAWRHGRAGLCDLPPNPSFQVGVDQHRGYWRFLSGAPRALYTRIPRDPDMARRAVSRPEVQLWFTRPGGESHSFNMFPDLHRIRCPTLVLGGEDDPMHPIESQADLAAALPAGLAQFERFENCRHAVVPDAPERAMAVIRDFILRPK